MWMWRIFQVNNKKAPRRGKRSGGRGEEIYFDQEIFQGLKEMLTWSPFSPHMKAAAVNPLKPKSSPPCSPRKQRLHAIDSSTPH